MNLLFEVPAGIEWFILVPLNLILILPAIFYLLTLQNTFKEIAPENRKLQPGKVWLLLIPLFNFVWHFFVVSKLSESIKAEAESISLPVMEEKPAYKIGLAMCILSCLVFLPGVNIACLVCWIIYWVKISSLKNKIIFKKETALKSE